MRLKLSNSKILDYPSGSALEYFNDQLYLIGDDSSELLILDTDFNLISRNQIFYSDELRIPKAVKPDFECATTINDELVIIGSGSLTPFRNRCFKFNYKLGTFKEYDLSNLYNLFKSFHEIKEVNIEGLTLCHDLLLFFNRANLKQENSLFVVDSNFFLDENISQVELLPIEIAQYKEIPMGISGAHYDSEFDILYVSVSAEATENAFDDGEIIGSGLAIMHNAFQKIKSNKKIVFDQFIDLADIDKKFEKQKIESITIQKNIGSKDIIFLVADNDDGKSVLFELIIE